MSLKDWKKISWWIYQKNVPMINGKSSGLVIEQDNSNKFKIRVSDYGKLNVVKKGIKTKSQALKFAKSYMRSH